jgi:ATP synthase protein I
MVYPARVARQAAAPVNRNQTPRFKRAFDQVSRYGSVGLEMGFSVAIGILIGYYLDRWLGTSPWLTLFLLVCGVIAGFKRLYYTLREIEREEQEPAWNKNREEGGERDD